MPADHVIERAPVSELLRREAGEPRPQKLRVLDLFSGIGGFSLGLERTGGFETVAFCEIEPFCRRVLNKHWPDVPIYEDVRELTADRLAADGIAVDVICGGFPCQDISYAGPGGGLAGERSGLWSEYARLIRELRPRHVLVENVAALLDRGMGVVLGDLAASGFNAEWSVVSACTVGAPHMRQRVFIVAYPDSLDGWPGLWDTAARSYWAIQALDGLEGARSRYRTRLANPSALYGGADGVPFGMERNRAIGNAVCPDVSEAIGHAILASEPRHDRRQDFLDRTQSGRAGRGCHPDARLDARMSDSRPVHVPEPRRHGCTGHRPKETTS